MKLLHLFCLFFLVLLMGCGFEDREKSLNKQEEQLNQKQQELLLWEQRLTIKERDLNARKQLLDSNTIDTAMVFDHSLTGTWQVKMQCIETSCDGSAIGDTKNEQWELTSTNNRVVVKVYSGKQLSRIYNGTYKESGLVLVDELSTTESLIRITLRPTNENNLEGIREIIQENCKIVYSLTARRS